MLLALVCGCARAEPGRPSPAAAPPALVSIVAEGHTSCAVDAEGGGYCWGRNYFGEAGHGGPSQTCGTYYPPQYCLTQPTPIAGGLRFQSIAMGGMHTCAITVEGNAWCWGEDDEALGSTAGNGCPERGYHGPPCRTRPVQVESAQKWTSLAAGDAFTCGVDEAGAAHCWGRADRVQAGTVLAPGRGSSVPPRQTRLPVEVTGGHRFARVVAGNAFACGLTLDEQVFCWGANESGQLGRGQPDRDAHPAPQRVPLPGRAATLAAGAHHGCALLASGQVYCWGGNAAGQLGDGSTAGRGHPARVERLPALARIAAGASQTCGVARNGRLFCWGGNLVDAALEDRSSVPCAVEETFRCTVRPEWIHRSLRWREVAPGSAHGCGIATSGAALCWGSNAMGSLGLGHDREAVPVPVRIANAPPMARLAEGLTNGHGCGLNAEGRAFCWGSGQHGGRGDGTPWLSPPSGVPVAVAGSQRFDVITLRDERSCAQDLGGDVWCWGPNWGGALMTEDTFHTVSVPRRVAGQVPFAPGTLTVGSGFACALSPVGQPYCWGENRMGTLGLGSSDTLRHRPSPVRTQMLFTRIRAGWDHACALGRDGEAYCWGNGEEHQLGAAAPETCAWSPVDEARVPCSTVPVRVETAVRFRQVEAGARFTCGLSLAGEAYCWGGGTAGRLGRTVDTPCPDSARPGGCSRVPERVRGVPRFDEIVLGDGHACGRTPRGVVYCWGSNLDGQLGATGGMEVCRGTDVSFPCRSTPAAVPAPARFRDISAGGSFTCGLAAGDAGLYCWGRSGDAQVGIQGRLPARVLAPARQSTPGAAADPAGGPPTRSAAPDE
ncbi:MAG TPA: hypothetical protein VF665_08450 [Longimicrobium sp.]|uniref:RCC1 domain-containing protein n=1 Tax=Longimicrobium sp. TaxID=2029185 RepID=UPI002ED94E9A